MKREGRPVELQELLASLPIPSELVAAKALVPQAEATTLVVAETDDTGREHLLEPEAANAWSAMKAAAAADGVVIRIASAFRSIDRQVEIVRAKLRDGRSLEEILRVTAPPGYSEHHTGRAVDVGTEGTRALEEEFAQTAAYAWLAANAGRFGFVLSFPPGNRFGYAYEPWHWCYQPPGDTETA